MKRVIKLMFILVIFCVTISCKTKRVPINKTTPYNNKTYEVQYLFEHDGCKVYRFMDYGSYVYFTNCSGSVTNVVNDSVQIRVINSNSSEILK
jgi:hypothetical protein